MSNKVINRDDTKFWESIQEAVQGAWGMNPKKVDGQLNARNLFYRNYLINIIKGIFEIECPDEWDKDYMLDLLILEGKFSVQDTSAGVLPLRCQPHGYNVFDRPTEITISNPVLGTFCKTIDVDTVIIYLYDNRVYRSFVPLIDIYSQKLASCDCSIDVSLINSRVATIFDCVDKKQADEAKLLYDKVSRGEPAVFYSNNTGLDDKKKLNITHMDVKNTFVADVIQDEKREILNEFLTILGINNANTDKKERLITDEVNANNNELYVDMAYVYNNIKQQVEKVKSMFPGTVFNISIPHIDLLEAQAKSSAAEPEGDDNDESDRRDGDMESEA